MQPNKSLEGQSIVVTFIRAPFEVETLNSTKPHFTTTKLTFMDTLEPHQNNFEFGRAKQGMLADYSFNNQDDNGFVGCLNGLFVIVAPRRR